MSVLLPRFHPAENFRDTQVHRGSHFPKVRTRNISLKDSTIINKTNKY